MRNKGGVMFRMHNFLCFGAGARIMRAIYVGVKNPPCLTICQLGDNSSDFQIDGKSTVLINFPDFNITARIMLRIVKRSKIYRIWVAVGCPNAEIKIKDKKEEKKIKKVIKNVKRCILGKIYNRLKLRGYKVDVGKGFLRIARDIYSETKVKQFCISVLNDIMMILYQQRAFG